MLGDYFSFICATHRTFHMILCSHIVDREGRPSHMVVVGWVEKEVLIVNPVVEVSGGIGYHLGVVSIRLGLSTMPWRICRLVVCSRPCLLQV